MLQGVSHAVSGLSSETKGQVVVPSCQPGIDALGGGNAITSLASQAWGGVPSSQLSTEGHSHKLSI